MNKEESRKRLERLLQRTYVRDLELSRKKLEKKLSLIKKKPVKIVKSLLTGTCPICFENIKKKDNIALLSCEHHMHLDCYTSMINSGMPLMCPICRKPFMKSFGRRKQRK
jgi:hypothetical protein